MITIIEQKSEKVVGTTSLIVLFSYNEQIISILKETGEAVWNKKNKYWELPCSTLSYLIDKLCFLDEIELSLLKEDEKFELTNIIQYKTTPFDYQLDGINWLINNGNSLLLDCPGLGKSLQIIYTAEELKKQKDIEHCLLICGINTLKENWAKEIKQHSTLDYRIVGKRINSKGKEKVASIKERADELFNEINEFFVIINIESLRDSLIVDAIKNSKNNFDMIVFDEVHKCLDYNSIIETDIGKIKIGYIVENKLQCKVKSFNEKTKKIEFNDIVNFYRYQTDRIIELTIKDDDGSCNVIRCTPDHKILTINRGWVEAQQLNEFDDIISKNSV